MLPHRSFISKYNVFGSKDFTISSDDWHYSYLPLGHWYERGVFISTLVYGGRIGFSHGNLAKITEDVCLLKPTIFCAVPKILNKIYDNIKFSLSKLEGNKKKLQ